MSGQHVMVIPYPVQGHVLPLMELALRLANHGCKISFVVTESVCERILNAMEGGKTSLEDRICLVSLPEEDEAGENRILKAVYQVMPGKVAKLLEEMNESEDDKVTCVVADQGLGWALEVAAKMGIRRAAFLPASAALLVLGFSIPKLIDEGIISSDGIPRTNQVLQLSPTMPLMHPENFVWARVGDTSTQKTIFSSMVRNNKTIELAEWLICNSAFELESGAFALAPKILPVGPLLASNPLENSCGQFWQEDSTCLEWLDEQQPSSVIYVAFGSTTLLSQKQFQELALGLELTNRPFLWVVRPDIVNDLHDAYPEGFLQRVGTRGCVVGWAPQQRVLSHAAVSCFLSHCGWNSLVEGVSNGVPFLCWPFIADQFINESYVCDVWKVGMGLKRDENGTISGAEIKNKVEQLIRNNILKERALKLQEMTMNSVKQGGISHKNFSNFIDWMKASTKPFGSFDTR